MSADLLAAFGKPEPPRRDDQVNKNINSAVLDTASNQPTHNPWILQSRPLPPAVKKQPDKPLWKQDQSGRDVLFDASEGEQEGDDFGDFETAATDVDAIQSSAVQHTHSTSTDLLGFNDFSGVQPQSPEPRPDLSTQLLVSATDLLGLEDVQTSIAMRSPSGTISDGGGHQHHAAPQPEADDDWGDFEDIEAKSTEQLSNAAPATTKPSRSKIPVVNATDEDSDWDNFEDGPPSAPSVSAVPAKAISTAQTPSPKPTIGTSIPHSHTKPPPSRPRPTNIPPPSALLQLLPQIYQTLAAHTRPSTSSTPIEILAHQILSIYTVAAHLISGRTLRWKRDTLLSQSIRISQAGLKNTGMKLTALDKSLTVKEDQDVMEAIAAWRSHAATFNAAMLKGKVTKPQGNLSANMPVRTATGPGVLVSKECCAVCGLKRNERVSGIDGAVEDTFGEWWVEFWGHRDCFEFWYMYEGMLSRR